MQQIICKMCGSTELIKEKGIVTCRICGAKYAVEETQYEKNNKHLQNARLAFEQKNWADVVKYYTVLKDTDPTNIEAMFYVAFGEYLQDFETKHEYLKHVIESLSNDYPIEEDEKRQILFTRINLDFINLFLETNRRKNYEFRKSLNDLSVTLIHTMDSIITKYLSDKKDSEIIYLKLMLNQALNIYYLRGVLKQIIDRIKEIELNFEPNLLPLATNIQNIEIEYQPCLDYMDWEEYNGYYTILSEVNPNSIDFNFCVVLSNFVLCGLEHQKTVSQDNNTELMNEIYNYYNSLMELLPLYCEAISKRNNLNEMESLGNLILYIKEYKYFFDNDMSFEINEASEDYQINEMVDGIVLCYLQKIQQLEEALPENANEDRVIYLRQMLLCVIAETPDDFDLMSSLLEKIDISLDDEEFFAAEIHTLKLMNNLNNFLQMSNSEKEDVISTFTECLSLIPFRYIEAKEQYGILNIIKSLTNVFISNTQLHQNLLNDPITFKRILSTLLEVWNDFSSLAAKDSKLIKKSICNLIEKLDNSPVAEVKNTTSEPMYQSAKILKNIIGNVNNSKLIFTLLAIFLGPLGIHNFYAGYNRAGIIKIIFTFTIIGIYVSWIWALVDIFTTTHKKDGTPLFYSQNINK